MLAIGGTRSMLIPAPYDPEWTDTRDILCDQIPDAAGVGAALTAMQALNLTPGQAAALVSSGQSAAPVLPAQVTRAAQAQPLPGSEQAVNGGRLPIPITVIPTLQLLAGDPNRAFLLIQNNEASGGATLLISFDPINTATPAYYLNFAPAGFGILLDQNVVNNPIYAGWSGTAAAGGVIMYGTRSNVVPTPTLQRIGGRIIGVPAWPSQGF